jgi:predicted nucleic acid-binding protein
MRVRWSRSSIDRNDIVSGLPRAWKSWKRPLPVCEPVLTEALYLLGRFPKAQDALFSLLQNGALAVAFRLDEHIGALHRLPRKYRDAPMSLADASIVRMAEIHDNHSVMTLDSDFTVYRKHGRVPIALMHPAAAPD